MEEVERMVINMNVLKMMSPNSLIFDIGAYQGEKSDPFIDCGHRVILVEPQFTLSNKLRGKYKKKPAVQIVHTAVGRQEGTGQLQICSVAPTISTLSKQWRTKGRFADRYKWDQSLEVPVTTLDTLIKTYGIPNYIKIDVEGMEKEVLRGLSIPVDYISFEFTIEFINDAEEYMDILEKLGFFRFNYISMNENNFALEKWTSKNNVLEIIKGIETPLMWGDIVANTDIKTKNSQTQIADLAREIARLKVELEKLRAEKQPEEKKKTKRGRKKA
jgi:FkbM family methyltransferase